jgi:hypothetical protein
MRIFLLLCVILGIYINAYQLVLYEEIIAVCSEIHTKHINTLCGAGSRIVNAKLVVHIVTTGLYHTVVTCCALHNYISHHHCYSQHEEMRAEQGRIFSNPTEHSKCEPTPYPRPLATRHCTPSHQNSLHVAHTINPASDANKKEHIHE